MSDQSNRPLGAAQPGGGKFGPDCEQLLKREDAVAVLVIVIGGVRGGGFSVAARPVTNLHLPSLLRGMADQIEGAES
jgi:hypothetical protein